MHFRQTHMIETVLIVAAATAAARADGVHVGRTADGQLAVEIEETFDGFIVLQPIAPGGLFSGWSGSNPGFTDTLDADATLLPLEPGAAVWLEVLSFAPAFWMIDASFEVLGQPGDDTFIGDSGFDTHLTYLINADDPLFDPRRTRWEAVFLLRDDGTTGYATSEPVTLTFTNAPPAADLDADGHVDLDDYAWFQSCVSGPGAPPPPGCEVADLNDDGHVDLLDWAILQHDFTG